MSGYRFTYLKPKVRQLGSRIPTIQLDEEDRYSPELMERKAHYASDRWKNLRRRMLKTPDCKRCMFCGKWATTLEHLVGHGEDAPLVAKTLNMPPVDPDWRNRFWTGPFCGSCDWCARSRSGAEAAGRLVRWTENWLSEKALKREGF